MSVLDLSIDQLRNGFSGTILTTADPEFDSARRVWNAMIDRKPGAIARCRGTGDVVRAVRFAAANGLGVAIRGGGHNVAGHAVCDGNLMIDLSGMSAVHVDPARKVAVVEGGATWAEVDRETQVFGLATPGGLISETGVAGRAAVTHLTGARRAGRRQRRLGVVEVALGVPAAEADGHPVAEGLAPLLPEPLRRRSHALHSSRATPRR